MRVAGRRPTTATIPVEVVTDQAAAYPAVLDELLPMAWHRTWQYANNHLEADHGRFKARLRPTRQLKQDRSARVVIAGHALVQNLRREHYELAVEEPVTLRVAGRVRRAGPWRSNARALSQPQRAVNCQLQDRPCAGSSKLTERHR